MNPTGISRSREFFVCTLNRLFIACYSVWMAIVLAIRGVPDRLLLQVDIIRRGMTVRRTILVVTLVVLITTPAILYIVEHERYVDQRRVYRELLYSSASETSFLTSSLRDLLEEQEMLRTLLLNDGYVVHSGPRIQVKVVATGYSSTIFETDSTPFTTASNTRTRVGILALSRDLLSEYTPGAPFSFGDQVHISGLGEFLIEDSMNARWRNRADVWFRSRDEALRFGVREVYLSRAADESEEEHDQSEPADGTASGL